MQIEKLSNNIETDRYLKELGVDGAGISILASKMFYHIIYIRDLHVGAANILKQDALSVGADLAVPRGTIIAATPFVDCMLCATSKQLKILSKKELSQPFGLQELAKKLTNEGLDKKQILIVNFEDPRFAQLDLKLLQKIYEIYLESLNPGDRPYIFLDEIQEVENHEYHSSIAGKTIAKAINPTDIMKTPGILICGDGPITWGDDPRNSVRNAKAIEAIAEIAFGTCILKGCRMNTNNS